jgi:pilus assembly protein Flp/PilA
MAVSGPRAAQERVDFVKFWNHTGAAMSKALKVFGRFLKDENGAALIEYTVLLGILLIAVIATIGLVGTWVSKQWLALDKALSP